MRFLMALALPALLLAGCSSIGESGAERHPIAASFDEDAVGPDYGTARVPGSRLSR